MSTPDGIPAIMTLIPAETGKNCNLDETLTWARWPAALTKEARENRRSWRRVGSCEPWPRAKWEDDCKGQQDSEQEPPGKGHVLGAKGVDSRNKHVC